MRSQLIYRCSACDARFTHPQGVLDAATEADLKAEFAIVVAGGGQAPRRVVHQCRPGTSATAFGTGCVVGMEVETT